MKGIWLGIDLGTSGVKVVAVDGDGVVVTTETVEYPLYSPRPGWVEQDPHHWWDATVKATRGVASRIPVALVQGIGLSGQMHGLVALDTSGAVLRNAILWNDNRNTEECEWLLSQVGGLDKLIALTNNAALPGYTVGKILWMRRHEPELFKQVDKVLNPKDYLRFRMTGDRATDVSDASGTGLFDVRSRSWSRDLLSALDLEESLLPPAVESSDLTGYLSSEGAEQLGLPKGIQIVGGGGDAVLQTTSMGISSPGPIGVTLGTAGIVAAASSHCPDNVGGKLQVSCGNSPDRWHVMGVSLTAGGALQWWRHALTPLLGEAPETRMLSELAERSPAGSRGLRFLPYLVGERCPQLAPNARAAWTGLDLRHDITDMTRAVIEGALLNLRQTRDLFAELGLPVDDLRVSGGASVHHVWSQTLADVFRTPVQSVTGGEQGAAYGAALLAMVGSNRWESVTDALAGIAVTSVVEPLSENADALDAAYSDFLTLYPTLEGTRSL